MASRLVYLVVNTCIKTKKKLFIFAPLCQLTNGSSLILWQNCGTAVFNRQATEIVTAFFVFPSHIFYICPATPYRDLSLCFYLYLFICLEIQISLKYEAKITKHKPRLKYRTSLQSEILERPLHFYREFELVERGNFVNEVTAILTFQP